MDDKLRVLRVVVASPGDVKVEHEVIPRVAHDINFGCPTSRAFRDVGIPTADTEERARTFDTVDERK